MKTERGGLYPEPGTDPFADVASRGGNGRSALLGIVLGVDAVGHCIALATLCFAGALSVGLGIATGAFLLGSAIVTLALAAFSHFRVVLGIAQDTSIAILAPAVIAVGATMNAPPDAKVVTALAIVGGSALVSGGVIFLVGTFRLGRIVRLFPYPVAAGFLASSGYLLINASLLVAVGEDQGLSALASSGAARNLLLAVALAAALVFTIRRGSSSIAVLGVIVLSIASFYVAVLALGLSQDEIAEMGFLPLPDNGVYLGFTDLSLAAIDWSIVLYAAPTIAAVVLINLIGVLLNVTGVELALQEDVDVNRELCITGLTNIGIGAFGGLTSFLQGGATIIASKLDGRRMSLGLGFAGILFLACLNASEIVARVPLFVSAGLLMFIGISMLWDWLLDTRKRLVTLDWSIVLGIVLLTAVFGILPAITIGLLVAILSFAIGYASLPVVRRRSDGSRLRSVVDRSPEEEEVLRRDGAAIQILHLQAALFFGTVERLKEEALALLGESPETSYLVLDIRDVNTIDSAACAALGRLRRILRAEGVSLILSNASEAQKTMIQKWGLHLTTELDGSRGAIPAFGTLDEALERCEASLVDRVLGAERKQSLEDVMQILGQGHPRLGDLIERMQYVHLEHGDVLIRQGTATDDIFILESGRLVVNLPSGEGKHIRVSSLAPGAVVGELAHVLKIPRAADVVSDGPSVARKLSAADIADIESNDRDLAALLNAVVARALALKVFHTNNTLSGLYS